MTPTMLTIGAIIVASAVFVAAFIYLVAKGQLRKRRDLKKMLKRIKPQKQFRISESGKLEDGKDAAEPKFQS